MFPSPTVSDSPSPSNAQARSIIQEKEQEIYRLNGDVENLRRKVRYLETSPPDPNKELLMQEQIRKAQADAEIKLQEAHRLTKEAHRMLREAEVKSKDADEQKFARATNGGGTGMGFSQRSGASQSMAPQTPPRARHSFGVPASPVKSVLGTPGKSKSSFGGVGKGKMTTPRKALPEGWDIFNDFGTKRSGPSKAAKHNPPAMPTMKVAAEGQTGLTTSNGGAFPVAEHVVKKETRDVGELTDPLLVERFTAHEVERRRVGRANRAREEAKGRAVRLMFNDPFMDWLGSAPLGERSMGTGKRQVNKAKRNEVDPFSALDSSDRSLLAPHLHAVAASMKDLIVTQTTDVDTCVEPMVGLLDASWRVGALPIAHFCVRMFRIMAQENDDVGRAGVEAKDFVRVMATVGAPASARPTSLNSSMQLLLYLIYDMLTSIAFAVRSSTTGSSDLYATTGTAGLTDSEQQLLQPSAMFRPWKGVSAPEDLTPLARDVFGVLNRICWKGGKKGNGCYVSFFAFPTAWYLVDPRQPLATIAECAGWTACIVHDKDALDLLQCGWTGRGKLARPVRGSEVVAQAAIANTSILQRVSNVMGMAARCLTGPVGNRLGSNAQDCAHMMDTGVLLWATIVGRYDSGFRIFAESSETMWSVAAVLHRYLGEVHQFVGRERAVCLSRIQSIMLLYQFISTPSESDSLFLRSKLSASTLGTKWIMVELFGRLAARDYDAEELAEYEGE
ncbi:hypothetical protein HDU93_003230 [Gonapodya sp. JEL0774]|nr:hypothetical protein HDU93_003230 [Gonapodya sp. JEL0774]